MVSLKRNKTILLTAAAFFVSFVAGAANGAALELLSRSLLEAPATDARFYGETLLLCSGSGLYIFPDYRNLDTRTDFPLIDEPLEIKTADGTAFISIKKKGILVVDISNMRRPVTDQFIKYRGIGLIEADGKHLITTGDRGVIKVFTRKRRGKFKETSSLSLSSHVVSLKMRGDTLVAFEDGGVSLLQITKANNLEKISEWRLPLKVRKGEIYGRTILLLTRDGKLAVSTLGAAAGFKKHLNIEGKYKDIIDLSMTGDRGVLLRSNGDVIPITLTISSDSNRKEREPSISYGRAFKPRFPGPSKGEEKLFKKRKERWKKAVMEGSRLVVFSPVAGISIYERKGKSFVHVSSKEIRGFAIDLIARDGYIYLANGRDGVRIGRVADDGSVRWIGHFPSYEARDVALEGDVLILADGRDGIKTVDVSDPENPRLIAQKSSPFFQSAVVSRNGTAFVAGGLGGVEVYDVSKPSKIKLLWRKKFSEVRGLHVDDGFLYFTDGEWGFRTFSMRNGRLREVSRFDTPDWNCDCFVVKDTAYLADGFKGILIIDIKDRSAPIELGRVNLGHLAREIHATDGTVFVAAHTGGLFVIDANEPTNPSIAAHYDTADDARGVFADGTFVYLASGSGGVYVFRYKR